LKLINILMLLSLNLLAFEPLSPTKDIDCSIQVRLTKNFSETQVNRDILKRVPVNIVSRRNQSHIETLKMEETVQLGGQYSIVIKLKEIINIKNNSKFLELESVILNHRVGNGRIVVGSNTSQTIHSDNLNKERIGLFIKNDYINSLDGINNFADQYINSSVVKDAFIECSTL
jgi:hypothetical protein